MSPASSPPHPAPTVLPERPKSPSTAKNKSPNHRNPTANSINKPSQSEEQFPQPKLRLEIRDLNHPGASKFLSAVNASHVLQSAVTNVLRLLYVKPSNPTTHPPPTRSVTLILRPMGGVAYTTGSDLDNDHKEIHFSLDYINNIPEARRADDEIAGVLTHEMVHCFQWNGRATAPSGLIEGVADWVRLRAGLVPPHWRRETSGSWDRGYQHTAYFLDYLTSRFGEDTVRRVNEKLRTDRYDGERFWVELLGQSVEALWEEYRVAVGPDRKNENAP
ncbi:PBSP domain protein [Sodiomyces alkalinus F11]|uniref:PBSP domain protein n=1 Tax=Sodiomyces alkalinus (strain CBS 110278 / VKM F-3762 / F11) TaxID=1314773 RepID=A0A3N2PW03_SODAK|nr:PBSP domain protein [Sodiomyces alkalinus F11]ROT38654.1 PBSP domain protein [Sodiomyces alkalinus F11]